MPPATNPLDMALEMCGTGAILLEDHRTGDLIIAPTLCRRWSCPRCSPAKLMRVIAMAHAGRPQRHITLTLRRGALGDLSTRARVDWIRLRWRRLLQRIRREFGSMEWLAAIEFQANGEPHLHILQRGPYIPQRWLSAAWRNLTKHSFMVHLKKMDKVAGAIAETTKYLTKTASQSEERCPGVPPFTHSRGWLPKGWNDAKSDAQDPYIMRAFLGLSWRNVLSIVTLAGAALEPIEGQNNKYRISFMRGPPGCELDSLLEVDNPSEWMLAAALQSQLKLEVLRLDGGHAPDYRPERPINSLEDLEAQTAYKFRIGKEVDYVLPIPDSVPEPEPVHCAYQTSLC